MSHDQPPCSYGVTIHPKGNLMGIILPKVVSMTTLNLLFAKYREFKIVVSSLPFNSLTPNSDTTPKRSWCVWELWSV